MDWRGLDMEQLKEHLFVPYSELKEGDELTDLITIAKPYYLKSDVDEHIGKMEAELAALKEELRWRDASKELPPKEKGIFLQCEVFDGQNRWIEPWLSCGVLGWGWGTEGEHLKYGPIKYWRPLPKAPEDVK